MLSCIFGVFLLCSEFAHLSLDICYVTQGNLSCNLQHNHDNWKTLQVAEGVSHLHNFFFWHLQLAHWKLFLRPPTWKLPRAKNALWSAHFNKIALQVAIDMSHQKLVSQIIIMWQKVEDSSTVLATHNATFDYIVGCKHEVLHVKFFWQLSVQRLLCCKLQDKLPCVTGLYSLQFTVNKNKKLPFLGGGRAEFGHHFSLVFCGLTATLPSFAT